VIPLILLISKPVSYLKFRILEIKETLDINSNLITISTRLRERLGILLNGENDYESLQNSNSKRI